VLPGSSAIGAASRKLRSGASLRPNVRFVTLFSQTTKYSEPFHAAEGFTTSHPPRATTTGSGSIAFPAASIR